MYLDEKLPMSCLEVIVSQWRSQKAEKVTLINGKLLE